MNDEKTILTRSRVAASETAKQPDEERRFFSISEIADRWRCSRSTVYSRLRAAGANVLDFAPRGAKRSRKVVSIVTLLDIEASKTKRLR